MAETTDDRIAEEEREEVFALGEAHGYEDGYEDGFFAGLDAAAGNKATA